MASENARYGTRAAPTPAQSPISQDLPELPGREAICRELDQLVAAVVAGQSRALVLRGEPGIGKTALLDYLAASAPGCRIERAAGVQSELELAFAGLHQLCAPMLDHIDDVAVPQRAALRTALGLSDGPAPDRFLVGLAVLSLLSNTAQDKPLLCLVDDGQWLDQASAQVLAFAARRLEAESLGLVFAASARTPELANLPDLAVEGLRDEDARALLERALAGPIDRQVRDQIIAETRGNPLALLELPRGLTPAQLAGGFGFPGAGGLARGIEESFGRRVDALPAPTRQLLLIAAADPTGDTGLVWRAASRLGLSGEAAVPAAEAGLAEFGSRVRFRHPLVRSAAYRSASVRDVKLAHRALAEVTDAELDPDRRAWHQAQASAGPDAEVADDLERSADRARSRGGVSAAAAFLERSAILTIAMDRRASRALAAADAKLQAGDLAAYYTDGYAAGVPVLRKALASFGADMSIEEELRWLWLACVTAVHIWDDEAWERLSSRYLALVRQAGALGEHALALSMRAQRLLLGGQLTASESLVAQAQVAAEATGGTLAPYGALALAALRGDESAVSALVETVAPEVTERGEGAGMTAIGMANALLFLGLGRYQEAVPAAQIATASPGTIGTPPWAIAELIEAATRTGKTDLAADAYERFAEMTDASGSDWALGHQARARAQLTEGAETENHYREAVERLQRTGMRICLARARLLYGEWLRRERRRTDAREQLRTAFDMLDSMGVAAFAERARRELRATGETARKRTAAARNEELTAQETAIARLARDGLSNPEIGATLYISPHTVQYHLRKIFAKLGITARSQLDRALPDQCGNV